MKCVQSLCVLSFLTAFVSLPAWSAPMISIKNHKQIYSTMSVVTGVASNNATVSTLYKKIYKRLPENNDVASLSAPVLLSITTLAGGFCSELIKAEALLQPANRKFFGSIDFTKTQNDVTAGALTTVATNLAKNFWGYAPSQKEVDVLTKSFSSASTNQTASVDNLKKILYAPCTTALASVEVYTQQ